MVEEKTPETKEFPVGKILTVSVTGEMEKAYLDEKGIKYENFFVDQDEKLAEEMVKKTGQMGVPVTVITKDDNSETLIVGFDRKRIDKELNIK